MGRGRAKAKQTKVARELKYSTHGTDLERLQRELAAGGRKDGDVDVELAAPDDDAVWDEFDGDDDEDDDD